MFLLRRRGGGDTGDVFRRRDGLLSGLGEPAIGDMPRLLLLLLGLRDVLGLFAAGDDLLRFRGGFGGGRRLGDFRGGEGLGDLVTLTVRSPLLG